MSKYIAKRFPLALDLQLFAEGGAAGGEGGNGGEGGSAANAEGGSNPGKTFTQAELDAAVQSRLSRAEKAAQKSLAKELGYDSVEAMQAALKKDTGSDKDKEKLNPADIDSLVDERIKEREKEQNDKTFKRLLTAEVKVLANELEFADWEDAHVLADLSQVKENDKGELEGVKEALETLAKKKPHLLKSKQGGGRIGADIGGGAPGDKKKRQEEMINLAKSRGTIGGQAVNDPWAKN
ncbi:scaffolding protein [Bacillus sp. FJAT-18019]|nr:scaffolding protein [Bacillus sp. FJAT-18019]